MNRITAYILGIFCLAITESYSQNLFIKDVMLKPEDKTAVTNPCLDNNGDTCALVRIMTDNLEGLQFDNTEQYVKAQSTEKGVYEVYMPYLLNKLSYKHSDYLSGQINFADFGFRRLKKGKTYVVRIETPSSSGKVVLKVQPASAKVSFNGEEVKTEQPGVYEIPATADVHEYSVEAANYVPFQGFVQVGKSEVKVIPLSLKPIYHMVNIKANVDGATVYVDGIDYGKVGSNIKIAQGTHNIRVVKDKYIDIDKTVEIDSTVNELSYSLEKNKNVLEIHAIPVTIKSSADKIYKNNKRIREWQRNGNNEVKFMPGKYKISTAWGKSVIIEVKDKPFEVEL